MSTIRTLLGWLGLRVEYESDFGVHEFRYNSTDAAMQRPVHSNMSVAPPWARRRICKPMTRERARERLHATPEFIPGPCPRCGACTFEEAEDKCRPMQLPSGEYECGTPDDGPNLQDDPSGPLYQRNPVYDQLDGYLWGWYALDEGLTKEEPEWP